MTQYHNIAADLRRPTQDLRAAIPDTWAGFAELHKSAMAMVRSRSGSRS